MSTTAVQIEANRANSQLSTWPRTDAGKQASSRNATKTGLTSAKIFVRPEEQDEFDSFTLKLHDEFQPTGEFQTCLFEQILHATWNIRRCIALENEIQNEAISQGHLDALLDDALAKKLDRVYKYKKMHESAQRRATADLRKLQSEQTWREHNENAAAASILADISKVAADTFRAVMSKAKAEAAVSFAHLQTSLDEMKKRRQALESAQRDLTRAA